MPENCNQEALAQWKAGFIADAMDLHLGCKPLFAAIISDWGKKEDVRKVWAEWQGGTEQLEEFMTRVNLVVTEEGQRFSSSLREFKN